MIPIFYLKFTFVHKHLYVIEKLNKLKISAWMAMVVGFLLPFAESFRRINILLDPSQFLKWFDDYILGFILVYTSYLVFSDKINSKIYLLAAWGIAVGGVANSLNLTIHSTKINAEVFSHSVIILGKALFLIYMLIGLILCIKANKEIEQNI